MRNGVIIVGCEFRPVDMLAAAVIAQTEQYHPPVLVIEDTTLKVSQPADLNSFNCTSNVLKNVTGYESSPGRREPFYMGLPKFRRRRSR